MSKTSKKLDRNTIQRVLQLIRPYKGMVILTLTLALITVVTTLLAPVLAGRAVDKIVGPGQVDYQGLGRIALAMAATIACTALSQWLMNVVNNRITFQVVRDMRVRVFEQLEILPLKYMDAHRPGDAISRITTDVEQFSDGLLMGFTQLFTGVLTILGTLGVMLYIDWRIALVCWSLFAVLWLTTRYVSLGSVAAAISFPITTQLVFRDWGLTALGTCIALLVLWAHRSNIKRLLNGTESKFHFHVNGPKTGEDA